MTYNVYHIRGVDMIWCFLVFILIFLALATASVVPGLRKRKAGAHNTTRALIQDHPLDTDQGNGNGIVRKNL
nr:hypothetical protein [Mucilaginibacter sp. FT3.2]